MKAIAVRPGKANSILLKIDLPKPDINEIPNGRGVLVRVIRVGVILHYVMQIIRGG